MLGPDVSLLGHRQLQYVYVTVIRHDDSIYYYIRITGVRDWGLGLKYEASGLRHQRPVIRT